MEHNYNQITKNIVTFGESSELVDAIIVIGSRARQQNTADQYSDLDIMMVVSDVRSFLEKDDWLNQIARFYISFVETTIAGQKEKRVLFEDAQDVDFIFLSKDSMKTILESEDGKGILARGNRILVDKIGISEQLKQISASMRSYSPPGEQEFLNLVNDFWFHAVWAAKRIARGEQWVAKTCLDSYLKGLLLSMMEFHAHATKGFDYDTWHNGRFLEEWADCSIVKKIPATFAAYNKKTMVYALQETMELFGSLAEEATRSLTYSYPSSAEEYARKCVSEILKESPSE